jgi:ATP-dependent exoDNAse (exonuclease V) alpha subunit
MLIKNLHEPEFRGPQALVNGSVGTVQRFEREDGSLPHDELFPVVRFDNGRELLVPREHFETELSGRGTCVRRQVPLKLAWAMTVDKSQGATLEEVVVDLNHVGRSGQAYVALSRVTREAGLQVIPSARQWAPKASGLVRHFYDAIATGDDAVVASFLEQRAGLFWFPILEANTHPGWLDLFRHAQGNTAAADKFSQWVCRYSPKPSLEHWRDRQKR